jgi:hypothetical protein
MYGSRIRLEEARMRLAILCASIFASTMYCSDADAQYRRYQFGFAPQPRFYAQPQYYGPMPRSTPMIVQQSPPYAGMWRYGGQVVTGLGRSYGGQYLVEQGYPVLGRVVGGSPWGTVLMAPFWPPAGYVQ